MINIEYELTIEDEHESVRGNACATDEPELDKATEDEIIERLNRGDLWAWCCVKVTARIAGFDFEGVDYLGCCSYSNEADFKVEGGYYPDMCNNALEDLLRDLSEAVVRGTLAHDLFNTIKKETP